MRRKILISINDEIRNCKFGARGCMLEAQTENRFGVPMCNPCYAKWKALSDTKINWDEAWLEMAEKTRSNKNLPQDDTPDDEFYCGED